MNNLYNLLERNKDFAAQQSAADTLMPSLPKAMPNVKAIIIGCADMRVDPAHVLGIKLGEAVLYVTSAGESLLDCWSNWGYSGESVRLPERFLETAESFTSSYFSIPIAASLVLPVTQVGLRTIFKYRKKNSRKKPLPIPTLRLPWTLLTSGRFPRCRASG